MLGTRFEVNTFKLEHNFNKYTLGLVQALNKSDIGGIIFHYKQLMYIITPPIEIINAKEYAISKIGLRKQKKIIMSLVMRGLVKGRKTILYM